MLADARNGVHLSQERASELSDIPKKALAKYEVYPEEAPPERILKLSQTYKDPEILEWYCTDVCPVGKSCHSKLVVNDLSGAAMKVIKETDDLHGLSKLIMEMFWDGKIDESELIDLEKVMTEIEHTERAIHALRAKVAQEMARLEKEKSPVRQHRRVS